MTRAKDFYSTADKTMHPLLCFGAGSTDGQVDIEWGRLEGPAAYDGYMLYRYMQDLLTYDHLSRTLPEYSFDEVMSLYQRVHHPNDLYCQLRKLIALSCFPKTNLPSYYELGSTLMGCIEGISFCQKLIAGMPGRLQEVNLQSIAWHGTDISDCFNKLAVRLHPDFKVDVREDRVFDRTFNVLFAKGVSLLYAVASEQELVEVLAMADLSVFDYSFSLGGPETCRIGTGVEVFYQGVTEAMEYFKTALPDWVFLVNEKKSRIDKASNRLYVEAIVGEPTMCEQYVSAHSNFFEANAAEEVLSVFETDNHTSEWLSLEEFMQIHA